MRDIYYSEIKENISRTANDTLEKVLLDVFGVKTENVYRHELIYHIDMELGRVYQKNNYVLSRKYHNLIMDILEQERGE